jgi:hypothetical protein
MGTTPTATNTAAGNINTLINGIEGIVVPIIQGAIIAAVPTLGLPVIKQIVDAIEQDIANEATKIVELYADFVVMDSQVDSEETSVSTALAAVIAAEKTGDQNAIQQAIQLYQTSLSSLDHSDGSVNT